MLKKVIRSIKNCLNILGFNERKLHQKISYWSISKAKKQQMLSELVFKLRGIVPDISQQYSRKNREYNEYWELKRRTQHAFQCALLLKALEDFSRNSLVIMDIGDSSGTHMIYLKELTKDRLNIDTISVNLDPRATKKIQAKGLRVITKRAEHIEFKDIECEIDLLTSFEMIEHLHNPAIFFRRIANETSYNRIVITVPYLKKSRVGLYYIRNQSKEIIYAEDDHIFELSLDDWTLLFLHSGWKVTYSKIYYQYPKRWPIISPLFKIWWRASDYEGFWGAILEKDITYSDLYQDWET